MVIRASIDAFHNPRAARYRRDEDSPEGYYHDSFDYEAVRDALLGPLGPGGDRRYRTRVFDWRTDEESPGPVMTAPEGSVLLFDGVFLLRRELCDCWDYRVFIDVDFDVALERAVRRDAEAFGTSDEVRARYARRYGPGQRIYLRTVRPRTRAEVVVDNNDPMNPSLKFVDGGRIMGEHAP